jgi:hypothetical protein
VSVRRTLAIRWSPGTQYTGHSHDGRQDHRDVAEGFPSGSGSLASDREVMAQECSFTDGHIRATWEDFMRHSCGFAGGRKGGPRP